MRWGSPHAVLTSLLGVEGAHFFGALLQDFFIDKHSMIMTLHDVGFTGSEIETYMRLLQEGDHTKEQRIQMLTRKRDHALDEIHFKEAQLARLDYLRHSINSKKKL